MKTQDSLAKVCSIAKDFYELQNKSYISLLKESGFLEKEPSLEEIEGYLEAHPELISAWLLYSGDSRAFPTWYFVAPGEISLEWNVGFTRQEVGMRSFSSAHKACAFYVLQHARHVATFIK